jgi:flavin-binding protein dodecin
MNDHVYRVTEIVGSSNEGIDQAIRSALERAQQTLRNVDWFEVTDIRGSLQAGLNPTLQVTMKVGFRLEDQ